MTEQQFFTHLAPPIPMPADVRARIWRRIERRVRWLRVRRIVWRVVVLAVVAVLLALAASAAEAQIWCDPCPPTVWLPIVFGEVQ